MISDLSQVGIQQYMKIDSTIYKCENKNTNILLVVLLKFQKVVYNHFCNFSIITVFN